MVLSNATKRVRSISSTIGNADNRCNGGMKKAGSAPTAGWMRKLNGVQRNYYFSNTVKAYKDVQDRGGRVKCTKGNKETYLLTYRPVMPLRRYKTL
tara:strand:- start:2688 stop:2975 length:288 start_codon:yes stop_codon:yes gene_type:complete